MLICYRYLEILQEFRAFSTYSLRREQNGQSLVIHPRHADSNGYDLGFVRDSLTIPEFRGNVKLKDLPYAPFHLLANRLDIWRTLCTRAEKQLNLHNTGFKL